MKRILIALALVCALSPAFAQSVPVAGTNVLDNNGNKLSSGQWCFGATCLTVTSGAFSGSVTAGTATVTVVNGATTYLTVPSTTIAGSYFSWDTFVVPSNGNITGLGAPRIACTPGAIYTQTDGVGSTWNCQSINGAGTWNGTQPTTPIVDSVARTAAAAAQATATAAQTTATAALPKAGGTSTGNQNFIYINNIPQADQFPQSDPGAKVKACAAYALTSGIGYCDATHLSGLQSTSTQMFSGLCSAGTASCNVTILFASIHFQTTVSQPVNNSGVAIKCLGGPMRCQMEYTGSSTLASGTGIVSFGDTANGETNNQFEGWFVYGDSANAADAVVIKATYHSQFRDIYTWGVTGCGFHTMHAVTDTFDSDRTSRFDATALGIYGSGYSQPTSEICEDQNTVGSQTGSSSNNTWINPAAEFVSGIGWHIILAQDINTIGGTSESNNIGLQIDNGSTNFYDSGASDFESNTTADIIDNGYGTTLMGSEAQSHVTAALQLGSTSNYATVISNWIYTSNVATTSASNYYTHINNVIVAATPFKNFGYFNTTAGYQFNGTTILSSSSSAPGTCAIGAIWTNPGATSASTVLAVCYPANTWTYVTVP